MNFQGIEILTKEGNVSILVGINYYLHSINAFWIYQNFQKVKFMDLEDSLHYDDNSFRNWENAFFL